MTIALKQNDRIFSGGCFPDEAAARHQAYKLATDLAAGESGVDRVLTFLAERHNSGYTGFKNSLPQGAGLDDSAMSRIRGPKGDVTSAISPNRRVGHDLISLAWTRGRRRGKARSGSAGWLIW
ncbi:MAG: hypothetical protein IPP87_17325 [Ideonella sp.]|nr:hypothetical protein [Ideonella sp.]